MTSNRRKGRINRVNVKRGAPRGSFYTGGPRKPAEAKIAAMKQKGTGQWQAARELLQLPLVVKSDGRWGYKHGKLRRAPKRVDGP